MRVFRKEARRSGRRAFRPALGGTLETRALLSGNVWVGGLGSLAGTQARRLQRDAGAGQRLPVERDAAGNGHNVGRIAAGNQQQGQQHIAWGGPTAIAIATVGTAHPACFTAHGSCVTSRPAIVADSANRFMSIVSGSGRIEPSHNKKFTTPG